MSNIRKEILTEFQKNQNIFATATALDLDPDVVRYHLQKSKIELPKGSYSKKDPNKSSTAPISQMHAALGAKVNYMRQEKKLGSAGAFAEDIGMSAKKYGAIERGQYDATIAELARVARGLGLPVVELFSPLIFKS